MCVYLEIYPGTGITATDGTLSIKIIEWKTAYA